LTNKTRAYISKIIGIPELDAAQLNMEVNFIYKSTVVKSLNKRSIEISSFTCIEDYDSCHESERYARSEQLVCLGILCFFTYLPFTMAYMEEAQSSVILDDSTEHFEEIEPKFISEGIDHSRNLKKLLAKLEGDTELSVTIIDRIRKGLYLEQQSHWMGYTKLDRFLKVI